MNKINLYFKVLDKDFYTRFLIPAYSTTGSAGIDLRANLKQASLTIQPNQVVKVGTAIAIDIANPGFAAVILPRSGMGTKGLVLGNLVGLIDSDYQGELIVSLWNRSDDPITIEDGERVAQLVIIPVMQANLLQVEEFKSSTERGTGGFGSTGKN